MVTRTYNNRNVEGYCEVVRGLSGKHNIILNDFSKEAKNLSAEKIIENDGVHFTPYDQSEFAGRWLKSISNSKA